MSYLMRSVLDLSPYHFDQRNSGIIDAVRDFENLIHIPFVYPIDWRSEYDYLQFIVILVTLSCTLFCHGELKSCYCKLKTTVVCGKYLVSWFTVSQ